MFQHKKKLNILWTVITLLGILSMVAFTLLPIILTR
ncbi:MAG: hypothetical protein G01um101433_107 [Parcubacteria group bacterium Gr01-1014_33]|nr:MAG: hypothetical protein G01um101433_107 [Parcubacteria group bacterium Gr01-1014_33]